MKNDINWRTELYSLGITQISQKSFYFYQDLGRILKYHLDSNKGVWIFLNLEDLVIRVRDGSDGALLNTVAPLNTFFDITESQLSLLMLKYDWKIA